MRKRDVPFIIKPSGFRLGFVIIAIGAAIVWLAEPTTRPGILESLLGVAFGLLFGPIAGWFWGVHLNRASEMNPSSMGDWFGLLMAPRSPTGFPMVIGLTMMVGMVIVMILLQLLAPVLTNFSSPWSHIREGTALEPAGGVFFIYILTSHIFQTAGVRRWYNSLED